MCPSAAWHCGLQCVIQGQFRVFIYVCQPPRALALCQGLCLEEPWPFPSPCSGRADSLAALALLLADTSPLAVEAAKQDLCACGFECWETKIGAPGVTLHCCSSLSAQVLHALARS